MSRSGRRNQIAGQFAPHTIEMIKSPAWRVLSLSARRLLDRIEIELADHGGTDNGKLPVTYDDFVRYGIDRHAVAPAIREVEALGFIEVTEHGRAGNADFRSPNKFRLTYRPVGRAPTTDEWKHITTEQMGAEIKNQCRKTPSFSAGNRHRKRKFHSAATHTTGHSGETHTTLDISGRDGQQDSLSSTQPDLASLVVTEASLSGVWRKVLADG